MGVILKYYAKCGNVQSLRYGLENTVNNEIGRDKGT